MTKSLLISIQPQHLLNILNGDKTYEVRKVVPKWVLEALDRGETVEAYLYCTKGKPIVARYDSQVFLDDIWIDGDYLYEITDKNDKSARYFINGTIPVKVVIDGYKHLKWGRWVNQETFSYRGFSYEHNEIVNQSCLTDKQLEDYGDLKKLYFLHISKVEILDEVMKLHDFVSDKLIVTVCGDEPKCYSDTAQYFARKDQVLKRPPQSFMTVWVKS